MAKNKRNKNSNKPIIITDKLHGLPYSKGLLASSIMATGLAPSMAYQVAKSVEERLRSKNKYAVSIKELRELTEQVLLDDVGSDYREKFIKWQSLSKIDRPLIILIGGTTGVGKSTIATELAHRLGITRIISTDAIRELMRAIFSEDLMPALYRSSFDAWQQLRVPLPEKSDPVKVGFREQTASVVTGVKALIQRSITEGANQIIEGVHIVPGFIDFSAYEGSAIVIPIVISVEDENLHKSHFYIRELETEGYRPFEKYKANFENIRKIGRYIEKLATDNKIDIISSFNLDTTISEVLNTILDRAIESRDSMSGEINISGEKKK